MDDFISASEALALTNSGYSEKVALANAIRTAATNGNKSCEYRLRFPNHVAEMILFLQQQGFLATIKSGTYIPPTQDGRKVYQSYTLHIEWKQTNTNQ